MEELHAGKGAVGVELARRPGEIVSYKQAIYGMEQRERRLNEIQLLWGKMGGDRFGGIRPNAV